MVVLKSMKNDIDDASNIKAHFKEAQNEFVDLGLPSGKRWKSQPEKGYFTYDDAIKKFGKNMPTQKDFIELRKFTTLRWDNERKGIIFTGKNGNSIFLPAAGFMIIYTHRRDQVRYRGYYWSATPYSDTNAYGLDFDRISIFVDYHVNDYGYGVVLVK